MRKTFFAIAFLLSAFLSFSQTTYKGSFVIKDLSDNHKLEFYTNAIESANFEQYRLQEKNVILEFSNGFKVELLSAKACFVKGNQINMNEYKTDFPEKFLLPTFFIAESSHITAVYNNPRKN